MPRITSSDVGNADEAKEAPGFIVSKGRPSYWPPKAHNLGMALAVKEGELPSAGSSSLTSESSQDKSGSSPQDTGQSRQSHARSAGSHSGKDRPTKQARSSSARSTAGSTQETGSSQQSQPLSSEASKVQTGDTPGQYDPKAKDTPAKSQVSGDS